MAATTAMVSSAALASSRSTVYGSGATVFSAAKSTGKASPAKQYVSCSLAEQHEQPQQQEEQNNVSRRLALALAAGALVATGNAPNANAAYGQGANIFGKPKEQSGYNTYVGDGFKVDIPSKWNPSKEREFPGTLVRYEDNFDQKSNITVMVLPTDKKSITDYGSPEAFLESFNYLFGRQVYEGKTQSEGGFEPDAVAAASLLQAQTKEVDGKPYYDLDVLTRTADGDEGGTHHLIVATINNGKLYMCKAQAGDKRWFKGAAKYVKGAAASFSVA